MELGGGTETRMRLLTVWPAEYGRMRRLAGCSFLPIPRRHNDHDHDDDDDGDAMAVPESQKCPRTITPADPLSHTPTCASESCTCRTPPHKPYPIPIPITIPSTSHIPSPSRLFPPTLSLSDSEMCEFSGLTRRRVQHSRVHYEKIFLLSYNFLL